MGTCVCKRNAFVKRKFHFRTISALAPHTCGARKPAPLLRLRDPAHFRTPAHSPPKMCGETHIYIYLKDTKQKNTTRIRGIAYLCAGARVMCGCAEMCGNQEIRTIPAFARCSPCAGGVRIACGNAFRLHVGARNAISCAQGAENAFPAFSERMT